MDLKLTNTFLKTLVTYKIALENTSQEVKAKQPVHNNLQGISADLVKRFPNDQRKSWFL